MFDGRASLLAWQTLKLDITCTLFNQFFHTCHAYTKLQAPLTVNILYYFHWPWLYLRLQGQCKAKPIGFIFMHTFHLIWMKFDVVKRFKLNIVRLLCSKIYWNKGNHCCFTDCIKQLEHWHALGCLWIVLHFDSGLIDCDLDSRS